MLPPTPVPPVYSPRLPELNPLSLIYPPSYPPSLPPTEHTSTRLSPQDGHEHNVLTGGLVLAPNVRLWCLYPTDGDSIQQKCPQLYGDGTCIPGCPPLEEQCTSRDYRECPLLPSFQESSHQGFPPDKLRQALEYQQSELCDHEQGSRCAYNELCVAAPDHTCSTAAPE